MFRYLPFVLKNSWRNRRRTLLTIVSISVSLCLLGELQGFLQSGLRRAALTDRRLIKNAEDRHASSASGTEDSPQERPRSGAQLGG